MRLIELILKEIFWGEEKETLKILEQREIHSLELYGFDNLDEYQSANERYS